MQYVTGDTPDISDYSDFGFYNHVSYTENAGLGMTSIGSWLGVYHRFDGLMYYWIMKQKVTVILRSTVQRLTSIYKET